MEWKASEKKHHPRTVAEGDDCWVQYFTSHPFRINWTTSKNSRGNEVGEAELFIAVEHYIVKIELPQGAWYDLEETKNFAELLLLTMKST